MILKGFIVLLHTLSAYNSFAIKLTRLIPGNICKQNKDMVKPMCTFTLIQYHVERIL